MTYVVEGFGAFGAITWDTVLAPAGYRVATETWTRSAGWEKKLVEILLRNRASDPPDFGSWPLGIRTCYDMARSLGLSSEATALCYRVGPVWPEVLAYAEAQAAAAEAEKWEDAICVDRAVADGGGAVCTAADGSTRVKCYHTDGSDDTILASGPCPPGTGGVSRQFRVAPKLMRPVATLVMPSDSKPVVQGRVIGPDGVGVAGASVQFKPPGGGIVMMGAAPSTTTDATGAFVINPKPGDYEIEVKAAGLLDGTFGPVTVPATGVMEVGSLALDAAVPECPAGQVFDPVTGTCKSTAPATCPEGQVRDPVTGVCAPPVAEEKPWYKSPWVWVIGGVVVLGGGYLLLRGKKKEGT